MFDSLVEFFSTYPYFGVVLIFLACGMGLPLPEEIVLMAAGFICYKFPERTSVQLMMWTCAGAIVLGDIIPFVLGRIFGTRLLRIRWLRLLVTRQRLARFDRWFRRRGDLVIIIARFLAGIRVVAFFTAGTMKMPWRRFLLLDALGVVILVPPLVLLPYRFGAAIEDVVARVQQVERSILYTAIGLLAVAALWWWLRRRRRARALRETRPAETYVEPRVPSESGHEPPDGGAPAPHGGDPSTDTTSSGDPG